MPRSHLIRMLLILTAVSLVMAGLVSLKPSPAAAAANGAGNELIAETALSEQTQASGLDTAVISPVFTPEVQHWTAEIGQWAAEFGLDPNLVATIMQIESCGDPTAVSPAGAQGLFQVMPFHFGAGEEMQNPTTNARRGLAYFVERLAQTDGDTRQSFAGYKSPVTVITDTPDTLMSVAAAAKACASWSSTSAPFEIVTSPAVTVAPPAVTVRPPAVTVTPDDVLRVLPSDTAPVSVEAPSTVSVPLQSMLEKLLV
ncbi:MAG: transglycosylase SLT domain-containing protein [Anaerolineae bacterium]